MKFAATPELSVTKKWQAFQLLLGLQREQQLAANLAIDIGLVRGVSFRPFSVQLVLSKESKD